MLAALVAALALAVPAPALAQSAGDDQYQDPFGGDSGESATPTPTPAAPSATTPAPATPAPAAPAPSASASQAPAPAAQPAAELPYTGSPADAGLLAGAGVLLLAGGIGLRMRVREPA
jgi:LPXTG-motif cell wall-anchored protein